jgi:hypothetical protein
MTRRDSESANLQETEYVLTESFSSFRKLRDLTLPTLWSLDLTHQVGAAGSLTRWATQFAKVFMNPEIDPATFSLGLRKSD